ncbi:MAG: ABC transporter ATP-binding protein [Chloroflexi bacterium]|nr:ABC transporter ATP-binding protein [Chloroflexota bacterium]
MANVTIDRVTKKFGEVTAVDDVTIEVQDKEFLVLVGPSGCGKSTTLRMVAGLEELTLGDIFIGGRLVNDVQPKDRDIAMVFQNYALYPHMKVYDNLAFGLQLRRVPKKEIDRRVKEAADTLGIGNLLHRKPKALSGGQRQRVALGRAIVREPKVFLMDEPLSNLDAKLRVQTRAEIIKLHRRLGTTIIYVTHDQVEAMTMGTRIAVMKDGVLMQLDSPQKIFDEPANRFVADFIGNPAMNFFEAHIVGTSDEMYVDSGSFRLRVPAERATAISQHLGRKVILGIRPEHIAERTNGTPANGNTIQARVDMVELLGSEAILYLVTGDRSFVARTEYSPEIRAGQEIEVEVRLGRLHLFDGETEKALH